MCLVSLCQVGTAVLGYGSGGTVVLQGRLDGRPVAVKRLLARFAELARTEINALIHTDDHPNVVGDCMLMRAPGCMLYNHSAVHPVTESQLLRDIFMLGCCRPMPAVQGLQSV